MPWSPDPDALRGKVAVVAGATRGAGRGIAAALGEAGATVVCTGRSTGTKRYEYDSPQTIEETAELVTSLGGTGIAEVVDHLDPEQVRALAERIRAAHGHVDVLVNDIWGGEHLKEWDTPVWEHDLANGLRILELAIETHLITSHFLLPLMIDRPGGLLVEVTDGTNAYNDTRYRLNVYYDLAKVAVNRLAFSQGHELEPHGATAVALDAGVAALGADARGLRRRRRRTGATCTSAATRTATRPAPPDFALSETPRFVGRAVVALATDPDRARWNQRSIDSGSLAQRVRVHRRRRLAAGRLALHDRGERAGARSRPGRLPVAGGRYGERHDLDPPEAVLLDVGGVFLLPEHDRIAGRVRAGPSATVDPDDPRRRALPRRDAASSTDLDVEARLGRVLARLPRGLRRGVRRARGLPRGGRTATSTASSPTPRSGCASSPGAARGCRRSPTPACASASSRTPTA